VSFQSIAIDSLLALSVWATLGTGRLSLAGPGFMAVGAYVAVFTGQHVRDSFWLCAIASAATSYLLGALVDRSVKHLSAAPYSIATLSLTLVVPALASATHITRGQANPVGGVFSTLVCLVAGLLALGFAPDRQRFAAGAAAAGVAGALVWSSGGALNSGAFGLDRLGVMLAVAIVGGAGNPLATVLGASLLSLLARIAVPLAGHPLIVDGAVLIIALVYLPRGVWPPLVAAVRAIARTPEGSTDGSA
jgi:branched-chain amino acid transport system permease protein